MASSGAFRVCAAVVFLWVVAVGCDRTDPRFTTPAQTYATYLEALSGEDAGTAWDCFSQGFRELEYGGSFERWRELLARDPRGLARQARRREITDERIINDRLAFVQFDPGTVSQREGPFFYFLHEPEGWKITTHLDSLFRQELEAAIERGEFQLPLRPR